MSKGCPTCSQPSTLTSRPQNKPQKARNTKVKEIKENSDDKEPEVDSKLRVDQVINSIHAMTDEERKDFLMKAFTSKGF
jgi:uncharacterized Zn finger protein (UPF0148 family)